MTQTMEPQEAATGRRRKEPKAPKAAKEKPQKSSKGPKPGFDNGIVLGTAEKPSALLIPSYIRERRAAAQTGKQVKTAFAGVAVLCAAAFGLTFFQAHQAKSDVDDAFRSHSEINSQLAELQPVRLFTEGAAYRQAAVVDAYKGDLDLNSLFGQLQGATRGTNVTLRSVSLSPLTSCAGPDAFAPSQVIGCVSVTARAASRVDAATFVANLNAAESGLTAAFAQNYGSAGGGTSRDEFSVTVNYTSDVLSMHFVPEEMQEQVKAAYDAAALSTGTQAEGNPAAPGQAGAPTVGSLPNSQPYMNGAGQ